MIYSFILTFKVEINSTAHGPYDIKFSGRPHEEVARGQDLTLVGLA